MAHGIIMGGGGAATSSDELTATSDLVVEGKSYMGADTDDDKGTGTMTDHAALTDASSVAIDGSNYYVRIPNGAYRKNSEKYGLTVYLCHGSCHICGEKAVHSCRETMDELHRYGQKMAMERMGWTKEDFMREFGRNYMDEEDLQPTEEKPTGTFQILDEELCVNW